MSPLAVDPWPEGHIDAVVRTATGLLERAGVRVDSPQARELLLAAGCREPAAGRITIGWDVVERSLGSATTSFTLAARDAGRSVAVEPEAGTTWVHNFGETPFVTDPRSGAVRPATVVDQVRAARIMHNQRFPDFLHAIYTPTDLPGELQPLISYCLLASETTKYVAGPGVSNVEQLRGLAELSGLVTAGSDGCSIDLSLSPVSPLTLGADVADALIEAARLGLVCQVLPCPVAGTTAPASLVGAVAQQTAEAVAMVVLAQAARAGATCFYGARLIACDPRTGGFAAGGPEMGFCAIGATLTARRLGLACDVYGLSTDSKVLDAQWALERALGTLTAAQARPAFLSGMGLTQSGIGGCPEALPIDDEILRRVAWTVQPADGSDEAADVDALVAGVLASTGHLGTRHSRTYMRRDLYIPQLANRVGLEEWLASGDASIVDAAERRVDGLLAAEPAGLPTDMLAQMERIIEGCAQRMAIDAGRPLRRLLDTALPGVSRRADR
jgi:trimethylamine--corrinoid protein Co-methyltransferase